MVEEAKRVAPSGKVRPAALIDSALWAGFKEWAKGQGKTLPKAIEDALRGAMIKQQAETCIAGDGKGEQDEMV